MLDQDERLELATFFARRLTPDLKPVSQHDPVDVEGWVLRLQERSLRPLAKQIRETCPEDTNLQAACRLLESMEKRTLNRPMWLGVAAIAASALVFVSVGGENLSTDATPLPAAMVKTDVQAKAAPALATPDPTLAKPVAAVATEKMQANTNTAAPVQVVERATLPTAKTTTVPRSTTPATKRAKGTDRGTMTKLATHAENAEPGLRCGELPEGVIGYWYAGIESPGTAGDTLTIDEWTNVREELPTYKNEWSTRTAIQCVLRPGDKLTLSKEPSFVPRDSYWVAIVADDVVEAG